MKRARHALTAAGAAVAAATCVLVPAGGASAAPDELAEVRRATAPYHRVAVAEDAGYSLFVDAADVACIEHPSAGAMGLHHANGALVEDPAVDASAPEVLLYAPDRDGRLRLTGVEHVVLQSAWHAAGHGGPPVLYGQRFSAVGADNRYGLPPYYALHAWVWEHNPSGTFADWNPRVDC